MTTAAAVPTRVPARPFSLVLLSVSAVTVAIVNGIVFLAGTAAGASMKINSPAYQDISLVLVIVMSLLPVLIAGGAAYLLARRWPRFRSGARWAGLAVIVLSMISPFVVAQDLATAFSLATMHVVVAIAWVLSLRPGRR